MALNRDFHCLQYHQIHFRTQSFIGSCQRVQYARNEKKSLYAFLEDPQIPVDNNLAERAVKPFVIGRNSWLLPHYRKKPNSTGECYRCRRFEKNISAERCFSIKNKVKSKAELVRENTDLKEEAEESKR